MGEMQAGLGRSHITHTVLHLQLWVRLCHKGEQVLVHPLLERRGVRPEVAHFSPLPNIFFPGVVGVEDRLVPGWGQGFCLLGHPGQQVGQ